MLATVWCQSALIFNFVGTMYVDFSLVTYLVTCLAMQVRVQSDPAGRLVISGEPEHPDNPWGVTPFKKVVSLPARIDPHLTSAVVTLHGQLFVRVPFEQTDQVVSWDVYYRPQDWEGHKAI